MTSDALTPEMQRRLLLLARYIQARSTHDLETVGKILAAAEHDEVLERMLVEASALDQEQHYTEAQMGELAEADRQLVASLLGRQKADSVHSFRPRDSQVSRAPLPASRRERRQTGRRLYGLMSGLAAALFCVFLLGGFLALTALYHHTTPLPGSQVGSSNVKTATTGPKSPWLVVPFPKDAPDVFIEDIVSISANDAWAIAMDTPSDETHLAHWNGQYWSLVPNASFQGLQQIDFGGITATASNDVWVVGDYHDSQAPGKGFKILIEHWNGQHWSLVVHGNLPTFGGLKAVTALSPTDVWAVGDVISPVNDSPTSLILHWDGQQWHTVLHPIMETAGRNGPNVAEFSAISAVSANDIWTVGNVSLDHPNASAANELKPAIEHWNGQKWSVVSSPDPGGLFDSLSAVAAISANNVWAVGSTAQQYSAGFGGSQSLIEHWNGQKWSIIPSSAGPQKVTLNGVAAVSANDIWAVGATNVEKGTRVDTVGVLEHWDGQKWTTVSLPQQQSRLFLTVAPIPGTAEVWIAGDGLTMYGPQ